MLPPTSPSFTEKIYTGRRVPPHDRCYVEVDREALNPRFDLRHHSPDGFEWGYNGSGPSQLALAVLAHEYGDVVAQEYYVEFRRNVIAKLAKASWTMTSGFIGREMARISQVFRREVWHKK
jgi:hypothetical protein